RWHGIDHRDGGGAGGAVAVVIGHCQGDGVSADVADNKAGLVQAEVGDAAGVAAAVVDLGWGDARVASRIQLNGQVLADGHGRDRIDHRDGGGGALAVTVVVSDRQGHGVRADVGAFEIGLSQARVGDAAGVAAAVVGLARCDGGVAGGVGLNGDVLGEGQRGDGIDDGHGGGAGGAVAVVVGDGQGD